MESRIQDIITNGIGLAVLLLMGFALVNGEARASAEPDSPKITPTVEVAHVDIGFRHEGE